jgi:hypothetical protein
MQTSLVSYDSATSNFQLLSRFFWGIGATTVPATPPPETLASALRAEETLQALAKRLLIRYAHKILLATAAAVAVDAPSVAGFVLLSGAAAAVATSGGTRGRTRLAGVFGALGGAFSGIWAVIQCIVCITLVHDVITSRSSSAERWLMLAGVPSFQVCIHIRNC